MNDIALQAFLDAQQRIEATFAVQPRDKLTALVMGVAGTGKTTLATTCPKPVLLDCFDEGGWRTAELRPYIERKEILVRVYDKDTWQHPQTFEQWRTDTQKLRSSGFFNFIGTYILDSFTSWSRMLMYEVIKHSKNPTKDHTPGISDYKVQLFNVLDLINNMMSLPCNVLMTAHLSKEIDQLNGGTEFIIDAPPAQRSDIPNAFLEKWVMRIVQEGGKTKHKLQLYGDGQYRCGTRIGTRTTFEQLEEPDVKAIMRKAGLDPSDKVVNQAVPLDSIANK